jgi:hypothetical protein
MAEIKTILDGQRPLLPSHWAGQHGPTAPAHPWPISPPARNPNWPDPRFPPLPRSLLSLPDPGGSRRRRPARRTGRRPSRPPPATTTAPASPTSSPPPVCFPLPRRRSPRPPRGPRRARHCSRPPRSDLVAPATPSSRRPSPPPTPTASLALPPM